MLKKKVVKKKIVNKKIDKKIDKKIVNKKIVNKKIVNKKIDKKKVSLKFGSGRSINNRPSLEEFNAKIEEEKARKIEEKQEKIRQFNIKKNKAIRAGSPAFATTEDEEDQLIEDKKIKYKKINKIISGDEFEQIIDNIVTLGINLNNLQVDNFKKLSNVDQVKIYNYLKDHLDCVNIILPPGCFNKWVLNINGKYTNDINDYYCHGKLLVDYKCDLNYDYSITIDCYTDDEIYNPQIIKNQKNKYGTTDTPYARVSKNILQEKIQVSGYIQNFFNLNEQNYYDFECGKKYEYKNDIDLITTTDMPCIEPNSPGEFIIDYYDAFMMEVGNHYLKNNGSYTNQEFLIKQVRWVIDYKFQEIMIEFTHDLVQENNALGNGLSGEKMHCMKLLKHQFHIEIINILDNLYFSDHRQYIDNKFDLPHYYNYVKKTFYDDDEKLACILFNENDNEILTDIASATSSGKNKISGPNSTGKYAFSLLTNKRMSTFKAFIPERRSIDSILYYNNSNNSTNNININTQQKLKKQENILKNVPVFIAVDTTGKFQHLSDIVPYVKEKIENKNLIVIHSNANNYDMSGKNQDILKGSKKINLTSTSDTFNVIFTFNKPGNKVFEQPLINFILYQRDNKTLMNIISINGADTTNNINDSSALLNSNPSKANVAIKINEIKKLSSFQLRILAAFKSYGDISQTYYPFLIQQIKMDNQLKKNINFKKRIIEQLKNIYHDKIPTDIKNMVIKDPYIVTYIAHDISSAIFANKLIPGTMTISEKYGKHIALERSLERPGGNWIFGDLDNPYFKYQYINDTGKKIQIPHPETGIMMNRPFTREWSILNNERNLKSRETRILELNQTQEKLNQLTLKHNDTLRQHLWSRENRMEKQKIKDELWTEITRKINDTGNNVYNVIDSLIKIRQRKLIEQSMTETNFLQLQKEIELLIEIYNEIRSNNNTDSFDNKRLAPEGSQTQRQQGRKSRSPSPPRPFTALPPINNRFNPFGKKIKGKSKQKMLNFGRIKKKLFIQEANRRSIIKGTAGMFRSWCNSQGLTKNGKVTLSCINKAKRSKNPTLRKRANFAKNIGGYVGSKRKTRFGKRVKRVKKVKKIKKKYTKAGGRKSPGISATKFKVGIVKKGLDGNKWIIVKVGKIKRWKKIKNNFKLRFGNKYADDYVNDLIEEKIVPNIEKEIEIAEKIIEIYPKKDSLKKRAVLLLYEIKKSIVKHVTIENTMYILNTLTDLFMAISSMVAAYNGVYLSSGMFRTIVKPLQFLIKKYETKLSKTEKDFDNFNKTKNSYQYYPHHYTEDTDENTTEYTTENIAISNAMKILNIINNQDEQEIKRQYKKLILKYHPDKCGDNVNARELCKEKFIELTNAYKLLLNNLI